MLSGCWEDRVSDGSVSAPGERPLGAPGCKERVDALASVRGVEQCDRGIEQQRVRSADAVAEVGMRKSLDDLERARRAVSQSVPEPLRLGVQFVLREHAIYHAPRGELLGGVKLAAQRDRLRSAQPRPGGDPLDAAGERDDADSGL